MAGEMVSNRERRGFRIGDAMILVAAVAFGLYLSRTTLKGLLPAPPKSLLKADAFRVVRDSLPYIASFLLPGTIACLIVSLRHGRSTPGWGLDSPGMAATAASACVIAIQSASTALLILAGTRSDFIGSPLN
jgi:hypothetical protein